MPRVDLFAVEWLEVEADAVGVQFGEAAPAAPFSLDWAAGVRAKAVASASHLCAPCPVADSPSVRTANVSASGACACA